MTSFSESFRRLRRQLKARLPYVRRREYLKVQRKYAELRQELACRTMVAAHAGIFTVKPLAADLGGDVCFFVSFASKSQLKAHVRHHIQHLINAGIKVVLIINTDLKPQEFVFEEALHSQLSGVFIRENAGFDFAAWAHVYSLVENHEAWTRLFLVNDSIVGPLNEEDFKRLIARVRNSPADFLGLTENHHPNRHLQSFFLVLGSTALKHPSVQRLFRQRILSFSTKSQVIDIYETQLTQLMEELGLKCEALFPAFNDDMLTSNDTFFKWPQLIHAGFPYIKTSVIKDSGDHQLIQALVPPEFRGSDY